MPTKPCGNKVHISSAKSLVYELNFRGKSFRNGAHLSEIRCSLVEIHLLRHLLIPGKRVQHSRMLLGMLQRSIVNAVNILDLLVFFDAWEAFLLDARAVQHVAPGENLWAKLLRLA
ncbi:hypothetical protein RRF57_000019 [Xylaria bambusicola]|uniref:Uncharacterized protein n=1 Tax=Xylaria bambusicola TaxID=326684 RepID=A0AAN7UA13_9PEZI